MRKNRPEPPVHLILLSRGAAGERVSPLGGALNLEANECAARKSSDRCADFSAARVNKARRARGRRPVCVREISASIRRGGASLTLLKPGTVPSGRSYYGRAHVFGRKGGIAQLPRLDLSMHTYARRFGATPYPGGSPAPRRLDMHQISI